MRQRADDPVHPIIRPRGGDFATATVSLPPFLKMCVRELGFWTGDGRSRC